jgi:hypothetical protein
MASQPQTMQLSPQAQQQEMLRKAGVIAAPMTGGQAAQAALGVGRLEQGQERIGQGQQRLDLQQQAFQERQKMNDARMQLANLVEQRRSESAKIRDELVKAQTDALANPNNPMYQAKLKALQAQSKRADALTEMAQTGRLNYMMRAYGRGMDGNILMGVPVIEGVPVGTAMRVEPTSVERQRAQLADNAIDNIDEAIKIIDKRPDLFGLGPGGLGSQLEYKIGQGDPDAVSYKRYTDQANFAGLGIHGFRSKYGLTEIGDFNSKLYADPVDLKANMLAARHSAENLRKNGTMTVMGPNGPIKVDWDKEYQNQVNPMGDDTDNPYSGLLPKD